MTTELTTTTQWGTELSYSVPGDTRRVEVTAPADTPVGEVLDRLAEHAGLGFPGMLGAVAGRSEISRGWLERSLSVVDSGLLRGEALTLSVASSSAPAGASSGPLSRWPGRPAGSSVDGKLRINRPPRPSVPEPAGTVVVPPTPVEPARRRFPLGAMLVPLVLAGVLLLVLRRWDVLLFTLFTPVMLGWNYVEEHRDRGREGRAALADHREQVAQAVQGAGAIRDMWQRWMGAHYPAPEEVFELATTLSPRLWERRRGDFDFLATRIGTGTRVAPVSVHVNDHGSVREPDVVAAIDAARTVASAPIIAPLREGSLAIVVAPEGRRDVRSSVAGQLAVLHSPADLWICAALPSSASDEAEILRWLPHVPDRIGDAAAVAVGPAQSARTLRAIAELRRIRQAHRGPLGPEEPDVVVLVDQDAASNPAVVGALLDGAHEGIHVIWFTSDQLGVPGGCRWVVSAASSNENAVATDQASGASTPTTVETLDQQSWLAVTRALAPLLDAAARSSSGSVPETVELPTLVPGFASAPALRRRWDDADPDDLSALIGVSAEGPVLLNFDGSSTGSHVLIAGTTGAGKSELLQTLVASLATRYSPTRVGFLLVDYKGGTAFKDAVRLPHTVGLVTDLDHHLTRRVKLALESELRRRLQLQSQAGVSDMRELRRRAPDQAPGDLIVVVDEFATLVADVPEFVDAVIDIAQRGRSVGMRLVLATQRPAGVITPQIRSNTSSRIALRVTDEADSADVVDSRLAAHIPRNLPGRAYLKRDGDPIEFQSAYVGGPPPGSDGPTVVVHDLDLQVDGDPTRSTPVSAGPRTSSTSSRGTPSGTASGMAPGATALTALVEAAQDVMRIGRRPRPHTPWLPPLPTVITLAETGSDLDLPTRGPAAVVVGRTDEPSAQRQRPLVLDLARQQNLLIFGTARSGKTTALRTLAAALVERFSPDEVRLYGLDFGGHGLQVLDGAPHCGGVVGGDDLGRVSRVLRLMRREVDDRTRRARSDSRSTDATSPRIVVLLDSYAGAASTLERVDGGRLLDLIVRLVAEGPAVGVHFVITADRRGVVPSSLTSVVTSRLVLRMAERDDYALLGVDLAAAGSAALTPGRGFVAGSIEVQLAVVAPAVAGGSGMISDPSAELAALTQLFGHAGARWPGVVAPKVGAMPRRVALPELPTSQHPFVLPLGIGESALEPIALDLSDGNALVSGPPRGGRSTTLRALAHGAGSVPGAGPCLLLAVRAGRTADPAVAIDVGDPTAVDGAFAAVEDALALGKRVLVLCDDADEYPDPVASRLEALARRAREEPVRLVAAVETRTALRAYSGLIPELRKAKNGVLLSPNLDTDGDLLGVRLHPAAEPSSGAGRGFLVHQGDAELVQVAL